MANKARARILTQVVLLSIVGVLSAGWPLCRKNM